MSVFGYGTKFGVGTKFGAKFVDPPIPIFEVDWKNSGTFAGSAEAMVSSYFTDAGRSYLLNQSNDGFEQDDTGKVTVVLANLDDRYTWSNKNSPIYPYAQAGKRFRLRVRWGYGVYFLAVGTITNIVTYGDDNGRKFARIEAQNDFRMLRAQNRTITTAIQRNMYINNILNTILDSLVWTGGRDIQTGTDQYQFWWASGETAANLIYDIVQAELGNCYITANGTLTFRTRYNLPSPSFALTDNDIDINSIQSSAPSDNVKSKVNVTAHPVIETGTVVLFSSASPIKLANPFTDAPNSTQVIWGDYTYLTNKVAAGTCITPVAYTDYTANSAQDGSGSDQTYWVTVSFYFFSDRFKIVLTNTNVGDIWVTFQVRGTAIAQIDPYTFSVANPSPGYESSEFNFDSNWLQNPNLARQVTASIYNKIKVPLILQTFDLVPEDYAPMFGADLGERVSIDAALSGIYGAYKIIRVTQQFDASSAKMFTTTLTVEPLEASMIDPSHSGATLLPFTLPHTIGV